MKTNRILSYALAMAAVASLAACTKETIKEAVDENCTTQAIEVAATLPSVSGEGMKTAFDAKDFLRIRFANSAGQQVGRTQSLYNTEGAEGKTVTFSNQKVAVPNDAASMLVYVDNKENSKINFASYPTKAAFSEQDGTLADAVARQVIMGSAAVASSANVSLAYKTGIVKVNVQYPVDPVAGVTTITIGGDAQYTDVVLLTDKPEASSAKGAITVSAPVVSVEGKSAEAYIAVWPVGNEYESTYLFSKINTEKYGAPIAVTDIKAGTLTTVSQSVAATEFNMWISDAAMTISGVPGTLVQCDVDWITKEGTNIVIAANKTGAIRQGNATLDNGLTYALTQIGPDDFKGAWKLNSKMFDPNKTVGLGNTNACSTSLTFGAPLKGETLEDQNGVKHTNNVGIKGLYLDAILDATFEIDYTARTVKFGVFLDRRAPQKAAEGKYVVFIPECASAAAGSYWTGYNFAPKSKQTSDTDYEWMWFDLSEDYKLARYKYHGAGQLTANGAYRICGISCVKATSTDPSTIASSYDVIYQANYNTSNAEGMYFTR